MTDFGDMMKAIQNEQSRAYGLKIPFPEVDDNLEIRQRGASAYEHAEAQVESLGLDKRPDNG